jgi:hypothetical protein
VGSFEIDNSAMLAMNHGQEKLEQGGWNPQISQPFNMEGLA